MDKAQKSIFEKYYQPTAFIDCYSGRPGDAVDVIIPVIHTNELWEANLLSIYREIPVHRLLIGDGGCIDNSIEIVKKFPRVEILDHRAFTSLGYSLRKLVEAVQTEWFVYLHSDVYLPPDWFVEMRKHQKDYDWFECRQRITALVDYEIEYSYRSLSGAQMGRAKALQQVVSKIDDDFLYRNEDMILSGLIREHGYQYGWANDIFHYHQVMYKQSAWLRKIKSIQLELELGRDEEIRSCMMQVKGLVKYLAPSPELTPGIVLNVNRLQEMGELTWQDFLEWVKQTNPSWLPLFAEHANPVKKNETGNFLIRVIQKFRNRIKRILLKIAHLL